MPGSHSAAALREHISLRLIAILLVRAKKLVSVEDAPSAPGEDKYPRMFMAISLMEIVLMGPRMNNPVIET